MEEKNYRKAEDKRDYNEQATIWAKDNEKYSEYEKRMMAKKREITDKYAKALKNQMHENETSKKNTLARMDINEALLNKQLLDELNQVKATSGDFRLA